MDSKEATSSPLSGSSPSYNDFEEIETVPKVSHLSTVKSDTQINTNSTTNGSSYGKINSSIVSDDEGFVSGEEEFEMASEKPIEAYLDEKPVDKGLVAENSEKPKDADLAVSKVSVDDDVEKSNGVVGVLESGKAVEGDECELVKESHGVAVDSKETQNEGFEGKPEIPVSAGNSDLNLSGSGGGTQGGTTEGLGESSGDQEAEIAKVVESENSVKDEEGSEDKRIDTAPEVKEVVKVDEESAALSNYTDGIDGEEEKPVEAEGVKLTPEGDSVVEAINVDVKVPGVAVVGETAECREDDRIDTAPEVKEVVKVDEESGTLSNYSAGIDGEEEKPVEADGVKLTLEGDSVVEAINVDVKVAGVAVVGETAENEAVKVKETELPVIEGATLLNNDNSRTDIVEDTIDMATTGADDPSSEPATGGSVKKEEPKPVQPISNGIEVLKDEKSEIAVVDTSSIANGPQVVDKKNTEVLPETEIEQLDPSKTKENGPALDVDNDGDGNLAGNSVSQRTYISIQDDGGDSESGMSHWPDYAEPISDAQDIAEAEHEAKFQMEEEADLEGSISDGENDGMIFGNSEAAKQFIEELEQGSGGGSLSGADSSRDHPQRIDGQIVTDSDDEVDTDEEGEGKQLFDSAALAALLKAATGADSDSSSITITSQDGSRLFSVERPAGLGSSIRSLRPNPRSNRPNIFAPTLSNIGDSESILSDEEKKKLEKLQQIRVRFLRLVHKLGLSPDDSVAAQVLYRLALVAGRQSGQLFSIDAAKMMALQLEAEEKDDLGFSVNILVLGKCGVGKSATINSIFGEEKAQIDAFQPATSTVKEITGFVDGVKLRVFDTPGLKCSVMEQSFNRSILSSVKKITKKNPPDIVLYVDRLDAQTRDLNDLPLLRTITSSLEPSIWRSAIVTLTHAASAPPDGPSGSPLSYEVFVTQRSHVVQQSIGQAVGDLRMMSPNLMNPVSLVENHPSCRKNREGQKVLPNGQTWRAQLLLLCYSMKILSESSSLSKPQDPFDHRKLFGFRARSPPLPYMLSSMLQSRAHPKLSTEQGGDNGDSDIDLDDLSDIGNDEEDEYDQLPPFKPLRKAQIAKLSREHRKAYFEEYDYRVKLLQTKQWKEELRRMREIKMKGKDPTIDYGYPEEDGDSGAAAPVAVPLPDMVMPPSFDSDNPAYRYRFLETSQFLARPVLDTHGWDHDCGYDGVNVEHNLAIANRFPASVTVQITKDKKDFSISLDSSISAKHGEDGSSMAGFDIQSIGKQLAYIVRGETKFKNLRKNKTAGGISITFLGENVVPGVKLEDQITIGKQYVLVGSAGAVRAQHDTAYGANFELQRREQDYPIGQVQSTFSMSVIKWRGDLALGFNSLAQFSVGRSSKVAVRAGINNKLSGQVTVRTSSSEHLSLALTAVIPTAISIYKKLWPGVAEKYSMY